MAKDGQELLPGECFILLFYMDIKYSRRKLGFLVVAQVLTASIAVAAFFASSLREEIRVRLFGSRGNQ